MKKISFDTEEIFKDAKEIDWKKVAAEEEKAEKEREKKKEAWDKKEFKRFKNIKCPVCQSTKKENITKTANNGIIGPGYSSWVTEEYLVCGNCGVMYKDLKKPKENPYAKRTRTYY